MGRVIMLQCPGFYTMFGRKEPEFEQVEFGDIESILSEEWRGRLIDVCMPFAFDGYANYYPVVEYGDCDLKETLERMAKDETVFLYDIRAKGLAVLDKDGDLLLAARLTNMAVSLIPSNGKEAHNEG